MSSDDDLLRSVAVASCAIALASTTGDVIDTAKADAPETGVVEAPAEEGRQDLGENLDMSFEYRFADSIVLEIQREPEIRR